MAAQATWMLASTYVLQPEGLRLSTSNYAAELGTLMRTGSS